MHNIYEGMHFLSFIGQYDLMELINKVRFDVEEPTNGSIDKNKQRI